MTDIPPGAVTAITEIDQDRALTVVRFGAVTDQFKAQTEHMRATVEYAKARTKLLDAVATIVPSLKFSLVILSLAAAAAIVIGAVK